MSTAKQRRILFKKLGVDERTDEFPKLKLWANAYVVSAAAVGEDIELRDFHEGEESPLAGTLRLICDLWSYCEWPQWLARQRYGSPASRGPWWLARFDCPERWSGGTLILRDPARFAFSVLLMASEQPFVQFELSLPRERQLTDSEHKWLADAVLSGVRYDYDDSEFGLICEKHRTALWVGIFQADAFEDFLEGTSHLRPRRDRDGIYWFTRTIRKLKGSAGKGKVKAEIALSDRRVASEKADRFTWQDDDIEFVSDVTVKKVKRRKAPAKKNATNRRRARGEQ